MKEDCQHKHVGIMSFVKEKFCLKWNDYNKNITTSFNELRESSDFSDVTLMCEEDQQIEAHRIILSASSPFFSKVLLKTKHSHPLIYMRGLRAKDLVAIVDFIYKGEANIYQEDLDGFLALAEELQLKGLSGSTSGKKETPLTQGQVKQSKSLGPQDSWNQNEDKIISPLDIQNADNSEQKKNIFEVERQDTWTEYRDKTIGHVYVQNTDTSVNSLEGSVAKKNYVVSLSDSSDLDAQIYSMMTKIEGTKEWRCNACGKASSLKANIAQHVESNHIEGVSHSCDLCGKFCRSRHALAKHVHDRHKA